MTFLLYVSIVFFKYVTIIPIFSEIYGISLARPKISRWMVPENRLDSLSFLKAGAKPRGVLVL